MTQRQKGFLYVNVFNNIQYVKGRFERREDEELQFFKMFGVLSCPLLYLTNDPDCASFRLAGAFILKLICDQQHFTL